MQTLQEFIIKYWDIALIAMVAIGIIIKLFRILGKKEGAIQEKVVLNVKTPEQLNAEKLVSNIPQDVILSPNDAIRLSGVADIMKLDSSFSISSFLSKSRRAYELITESFSNGNKELLRNLVSDEVYEVFNNAIETRLNNQFTSYFKLESMLDITLERIQLVDKIAYARIKIITIQTHYIEDSLGNLVEGSKSPQGKTELWDLKRDFGTQNPSWILIATNVKTQD